MSMYMDIILDCDSSKTTLAQVLSCNYNKTVRILHSQARSQSSTPLHYLNIAIYLCRSITPSKPFSSYRRQEFCTCLIRSTMIISPSLITNAMNRESGQLIHYPSNKIANQKQQVLYNTLCTDRLFSINNITVN